MTAMSTLPTEIWIQIVKQLLADYENIWEPWLSNLHGTCSLFKTVVETHYIRVLIQHMQINLDVGIGYDDVGIHEGIPTGNNAQAVDTAGTIDAAELDATESPFSYKMHGLPFHFSHLTSKKNATFDDQSSDDRSNEIVVLECGTSLEPNAIISIQDLLDSIMKETASGLGSHNRLFTIFEKLRISTDYLPAGLHCAADDSGGHGHPLALAFEWRPYLTRLLVEERMMAFEQMKYHAYSESIASPQAIRAASQCRHFSDLGMQFGLQGVGTFREDIIPGHERGRRIARRRRELGIVASRNSSRPQALVEGSSRMLNPECPDLRRHSHMTEGFAIQKYAYIYRYWEERPIPSGSATAAMIYKAQNGEESDWRVAMKELQEEIHEYSKRNLENESTPVKHMALDEYRDFIWRPMDNGSYGTLVNVRAKQDEKTAQENYTTLSWYQNANIQ